MTRAAFSHERRRSPVSSAWDDVLLRCVDASLAGVIFIAPLFLGGRHPFGKLVYVSLACAAAVFYCARQCAAGRGTWRKSGAEWLIFAALGLIALQMAPLPASWLNRCSPGLPDLLPLWQADNGHPAALGAWSTISMAPRETRGGLVVFLAHVLLFLTVVQRVATREDVERLLSWLAFACMGMASLGLLQYFFGNGKFLWVYYHPTRQTFNAAKGTFTNQNHFAQFLALGAGAVIWLMWRRFETLRSAGRKSAPQQSRERWISLLLTAGAVAVGFGGLLSYSRGGVIALMLAAAICVGVYARNKLLGVRSVVGLGVAGVVASIALLAYGYEPLMRKLGTLQESRSLEELSRGRAILWDAMLASVPNHILFGAGVGSHVEVYPTYLQESVSGRYTHGENGYLQVLLETGVVGGLLLAAGIVLGLYWCWRPIRRGDARMVACAAPVLGGIAASIVHSCGDFVWYISACMSLAVVLLACACRLHQMSRDDAMGLEAESDAPHPRIVWLGAAAVVVMLSAVMIKDRLAPAMAARHWDAYFALVIRSQGRTWQSGKALPADSPVVAQRLLKSLEAAVERDPHNPRTNLALSRSYLRAFEIEQEQGANAINLVQIRDAALASEFPSRAAQDAWLRTAIGENRRRLDLAAERLHQALRLCPLQGEAYVLLADLAFLQGHDHDVKRALVRQAERLRPFEGAVLLAAGQEAMLERDLESAMRSWKRAFHLDEESQGHVIKVLGGSLSAAQFVELVEPDQPALSRLFYHYQWLNRRDDAAFIAERLAPQSAAAAKQQSGAQASASWRLAGSLYEFLEQDAQALACYEQAVRAAPGDIANHRLYAFQLLKRQEYGQAIEQFRWCLRHDPDDQSARAGLTRAMGSAPTASF